MSRTFHIGALISAVDGPLCTDGGIGDVYDILGFLVNDDLWTHQLPTASRTAEPYLLEQFPWLSEAQKRPDDWPDDRSRRHQRPRGHAMIRDAIEARLGELRLWHGGIPGPSGHADRVYLTTDREYARHYASLYGRGDLYRVEAVGGVERSAEDSFPTWTAPAARVLAVYDRAVLLTPSQRRRLWRSWTAADRSLAKAIGVADA